MTRAPRPSSTVPSSSPTSTPTTPPSSWPSRRSLRLICQPPRRSSGQPHRRGTQVGAADAAGARDERLGEVTVDALVAAGVVGGFQPVRGGEAGQAVAGDDEGGEPLQREDGVAA